MEILKKRNTGIDILKALSVVSIIIYHLYEFKGTYIGVIVFFVISGYFITSILVERDERYSKFLENRFYRIYPVLITVLTTTLLTFYIFNGFLTKDIKYSSLSSLFGLSNIYQIFNELSYFERSGDIYPLLHTWTLSIEIQFYLLFPFLIYFLKKIKLGNKKNGIFLVILSLISATIMFYKNSKGYNINTIYYGTDTRIFSLFIGAAFYYFFREKEINIKRMKMFSILSGVIILVSILSINYFDDINYEGLLYFLSVLSGIVVVTTIKGNFLSGKNIFFRILGNLGKHSYCYYLWQYPIMNFSQEYFKWTDVKYNHTVIIQIIILIILSEISYIFLEERVKMSKKIQGISFILYVAILFLFPVSEETNSKTVQDRVNEVNAEMEIKNINESLVLNNLETKNKNMDKNEEIDEFEKRLLGIEDEKKTPEKSSEIKIENKNTDKKEKKEIIEERKILEHKYTFIGDSVMKMGEPYISKKFKNSVIDAKVSRQFTNLPKILKDLKKKNKLNDVVVVHLGTNGVMTKKSFEESMALLEARQVYFMNCVVPKHWEETINRNLREWSKDYSNVKIIDWYGKAKGNRKLFYKDATHPKPDGAQKYADFIYDSVIK